MTEVSVQKQDAGNLAAARVLVVDDNPRQAKALGALLRSAGYEPVVCHTGAETLAYAEGATPAVALIDIHLPDISGLVLSAKLREKYGPELPIVIVSGDTSMETINTLPHVGATYFFPKPINAEYLIERLRDWVG